MKNFLFRLRDYWPTFILLGIVTALFLTNYKAGSYLTGWDNLHPEFYFEMNIKRSIFAVWQEYQGLGLLGGMGHAADLPRQIFLLILSFFLPDNLLRYAWTFLMLFAGSVGAYFLGKYILFSAGRYKIFESHNVSSLPEGISELETTEPTAKDMGNATKLTRAVGEKIFVSTSAQTEILAFLGGLFYLLNLSTIQTFYAPYEAFTAHFAVLPWLLLATVKYFQNPNRKNILVLAIILFLSIPQAYIPTLFVTYLIAAFIISLFFIKGGITKHLKFAAIVFLINSFWLLPFLYFTITASEVNIGAKINQMATETIFLQNKEFGNIWDVILLRGFWFNNVDPNLSGNFTYMLAPWKEHLSNPLIKAIGFLLFGIIILGVIESIRRPSRIKIAFLLLFLFAFTMLATATPPFYWFGELFRKIPLFDQAFRFPFTKFSILTSLTYSIFFSFGIATVLNFLQRLRITDLRLKIFSLIIILSSLIIFTFPAFRGNLFYEKETLKIPNEYFEVFEYFKKQDQNTRIANFPQHTFWGWTLYSWGYGGSGFPWYGIKQPMLDRAFDVWGAQNENYYWETTNALYSKNPEALENVLNKYQINWLLIDKNVINPQNPKVLFYPETKQLLDKIPEVTREKSFGNIDIYKVSLRDNPKNFVFTTAALPAFNGYKWGDNDKAYKLVGNYISEDSPTFSYIARALFTGKQEKDKEFILEDKGNYLEFSKIVDKDYKDAFLNITPPEKFEKGVFADVVLENDKIAIVFKQPQIFLNGSKIWGQEEKVEIFSIPDASFPLNININGGENIIISNSDKHKIISTFALSNRQDNILILTDNNKRTASQTLESPFGKDVFTDVQIKVALKDVKKDSRISVRIPKIKNSNVIFDPDLIGVDPKEKIGVKNCSNFRNGEARGSIETQNRKSLLYLYSKNSTACLSILKNNLPHEQSYVLTVETKNVKGRPTHFWILNEDEKSSPIDTYFENNKKLHTEIFVIPPMEEFGNAYSFHFENESIGNDETENLLGNVYIYPIPYDFLTDIIVTESQLPFPSYGTSAGLSVSHPNESLYLVNCQLSIVNCQSGTLVLSQAYDEGWKAYAVGECPAKGEARQRRQMSNVKCQISKALPFLFGEEIKEHVKVNNWQNGWLLKQSTINNQQSTIVIIFLPQYLEYLGFILLFGTFFALTILIMRNKISQ